MKMHTKRRKMHLICLHFKIRTAHCTLFDEVELHPQPNLELRDKKVIHVTRSKSHFI